MVFETRKELSKARCLVCGATFYLDINGDWHCPVCGAYDGNGHIDWIKDSDVDKVLNKANILKARKQN